MTALTVLPAPVEFCDCLPYSCGHCACDACEECGQCAGGGQCTCECMIAERAAAILTTPTESYLGTHTPSWLWDPKFADLFHGRTLFVSRPRLMRRRTPFPRALHRYCIDSGGFSELQQYGRWTITPEQYVAEVRRYLSELGPDLCQWVAPQDSMCEELVIYGGIGPRGVRFVGTREARGLKPGEPEQDRLTATRIHQRLTVDNYLELVALAPEIPFIPVLQGLTLADYDYCDELYRKAGIDLRAQPIVGLGSVCRRQATGEIEEIVSHFHAKGYRLHGFGVKKLGLAKYAAKLTSVDSLAWSDDGRRADPLPGHETRHQNCANCPDWATRWHDDIVTQLARAA